MEKPQKTPSRKKFLLWGAAVLSSLTFMKYFSGGKEEKKIETVKMLTQDGKLVEINSELLASSGKKISDQELQQWVRK
jgi:hypothetical protein